MGELTFTVDAHLLRELGERLVGKPHIALAELVKNSYDADASEVVISLGPDRIEVSDNGHGMDLTEFKNYWMRIGSQHKTRQRLSLRLKRPMTGSKGVGRLAVQFLARQLELRTASVHKSASLLRGYVDWRQAVQAGDLTNAKVAYRETNDRESFAGDGSSGTTILLTELNQEWLPDSVRDLAREIWWLQPPFRPNPRVKEDRQKGFNIVFRSSQGDLAREFDAQIEAIKDIWTARLTGQLVPPPAARGPRPGTGTVQLTLEFADRTRVHKEYPVERCRLHHAEFEIRIYKLQYRQPRGIKLKDAQEYMRKYGGVHVYDAGFHLPYYGPDIDWLGIEQDHSHRLSVSQLLPRELQVREGLTHLPTQSRLLGVVHVDTSEEVSIATSNASAREGQYLKIQITRDRLEENGAFENLRDLVRWALDFYAMQQAKRAYEEAETKRPKEPAKKKYRRVEEALRGFRKQIPARVYVELRESVKEAVAASESETEAAAAQVALLAPLATAGICALAYQHEVNRQFHLVEAIARELSSIRIPEPAARKRIRGLGDDLNEWLGRARATRSLFSHLADEENREKRARLRARGVLEEVAAQVRLLAPWMTIDLDAVEKDLRLPEGTFAEWSAVFQNVLTNAANAVLDSEEKRLRATSAVGKGRKAIIVEDTGCGVDLKSAASLFKPFERKLEISHERRGLGLGGTGLGLTIVKLAAERLDCQVGFVPPSEGYSTAFRLAWSG